MAGLGSGTNYIPSNAGFASTDNTTTTQLGVSATYTGTGEQNQLPYVIVDVESDQEGTLFLEFSVDGTNWASPGASNGYHISPGNRVVRSALKASRYFRVRYVNGSTAQSTFRLYTYFDVEGQASYAVNAQIPIDANALASRPSDPFDDALLGLREGVEVRPVFARRTDLDTGDGDALIIADNTTNAFSVMTSADTFTITYNNATDGDTTTGALSLIIQYLDSNFILQQSLHTLGSTGSDVTAFTGYGINRAVVFSAGSNQVNANDITITDTGGATVQSFIEAGAGFNQEAVCHVPSDGNVIIKDLTFGAVRVGGGSSPVVTYTLNIFNRTRGVHYKLFPQTVDSDVESSRQIFEKGYLIRDNDVFWVTAETGTNNTEVFCKFLCQRHTTI